MEPTTQNKSSVGSIIGTIVIIAVIILGGLYFWGKRVEEAKLRQNLVTDTSTQQTAQVDETASITTTSSSDDLTSIEADLNNTKIDNLGEEMNPQIQ
jgi:hypothetical protein